MFFPLLTHLSGVTTFKPSHGHPYRTRSGPVNTPELRHLGDHPQSPTVRGTKLNPQKPPVQTPASLPPQGRPTGPVYWYFADLTHSANAERGNPLGVRHREK